MIASPLTLEAGRWYALQQLGAIQPRLSWEAATPVLIARVAPLKTGHGMIDLELVRAFAELGPAFERLTLRLVYRGRDVIIAVGLGWHSAPITVAISIIDMEWLSRLCPRLLKRFEPLNTCFDGLEDRPTAEAFLVHHLGKSPEALTNEPMVPDGNRLKTMPSEYGVAPFVRSYSQFDAWLLLRPVIPADMDFKWLIFATNEGDGSFVLRFYRSWTGILIYEVSFSYDGTGLESKEALINLNERQYGFSAPDNELALLEWLVDFWLLGDVGGRAQPIADPDRRCARFSWAKHFQSLEGAVPPWLLSQQASISEKF